MKDRLRRLVTILVLAGFALFFGGNGHAAMLVTSQVVDGPKSQDTKNLEGSGTNPEQPPEEGERNGSMDFAKSLAEIIALAAAAGFFLYRALAGYFIVNMSSRIHCRRQHISGTTEDYLQVTLELSKGDKGTIQIHDAQAKFTMANGLKYLRPFLGIDRRGHKPDSANENRKKIDWGMQSKKNPLLNLSPGEQAQFSCMAEVPTGAPCTIEVAVLGRRLHHWKMGQWRASCLSFPEVT